MLLPNLLSKHLKVWTIRNVIHTDIFMWAIPWSRLMIQREGLTDDLNTSSGERIRAALAGLLLFSVLTIIIVPGLWPLKLAMLAIVVIANWSFFQFMISNGGVPFAIFGLAFHQLYYLYSSAAFVWCMIEVKVLRRTNAVVR